MPETAKKSTAQDAAQADKDPVFNTPWHLSATAEEVPLTMVEHALIRTFGVFSRWMAEAQAVATHMPMSSTDNMVLNLIRMGEVPKGVNEIARFLNRDDVSNIQYSLRKLLAAGLIEKNSSKKRRGASYQVTAKGQEVTDEFARLRRELLLKALPALPDWEAQVATTRRLLETLQSVYENASVSLMFQAHADEAEE